MKQKRLLHGIGTMAALVVLFLSLTSLMPARNKFTAAEQQQVSIATPGLFAQSQAFNVDFEILRDKEYSFPLPVGKTSLVNDNGVMRISTTKGDAVKAMFEGYVRLSRKTESMGNVIVVRHDNGLETVYANNAENLVKVGAHVDAGQTVAIVGTKEGETYCDFSIMVNGGKLNPETFVEPKSHKLRRQTVQFRKNGNRVAITVMGEKTKKRGLTLDPDEVDDAFVKSNIFELDLEKMEQKEWAYPLPGARVISPYGGKRNHSGVDLKTKPNDEIVAAFDGEVVSSGPYYGYGNCIRIKHAYGFETLYSHQSKNLVSAGEKVKAGQVIGLTGRTGRATTEHLHFEVIFSGRRLNPSVLFDHANYKLNASTLHLTKGQGVKSVKN